MRREDMIARIRSGQKDIVSLLGEMISVPSPTGREGDMARWLAGWLSARGFGVDSFTIDPDDMARKYPGVFYRYNFPYEGRPNVAGVLRGSGSGNSLMINFHLDTVDADPAAWTRPPWHATVEDGRVYGRGSSDMKGGAAAALYAIQLLVENGVRLRGDLIVSGVIEEEGPGNGILALIDRGVKPDACFVPEPTELALSVALTGGAYCIITVKGRSSHSTTAWDGVNALEKAYVVIRGVEAWRECRLNEPSHQRYSHAPETASSSPVINVTRVDGGNIGRVPGLVQVWTRATVMPGEDPREVSKRMEETVLSTTSADPWLERNPPSFSWIILGGRSYPASIDEGHHLVQSFSRSIADTLGRAPVVNGFVSPADMQQLINVGKVPTVMFGPGSIYQAHTEDEYVPADQLAEASAVMADFVMRWCGVE